MIEQIYWDPLPQDDPDYQALDRLKEQANDGEEEEQDTGLSKQQQIELAQSLRDEGWTLVEIAAHDMIDYERSWVSEHTVEKEAEQIA